MENVRISYTEAVRTMLRVIFALILRETTTRYGRLQIGYLWAFIEPIMFIAVLGFIYSYIRMSHAPGMPLIQFLMTGYMSFMLFRDVVTQTMMAVRPNLQLLYFPQVQVFDLGVSRTLLEYATFMIVFPLLTFLVSFLGIEPVVVEDPLRLFLAFSLIVTFAYGIGTAIGALIPLFPSLQILFQMIVLRPLLFLSGVFFTIMMLPTQVQPYLALNPLLQMIELVRSAYFPEYESTYIHYPYLAGSVLVSVLGGLLMQRALRRHAFDA